MHTVNLFLWNLISDSVIICYKIFNIVTYMKDIQHQQSITAEKEDRFDQDQIYHHKIRKIHLWILK